MTYPAQYESIKERLVGKEFLEVPVIELLEIVNQPLIERVRKQLVVDKHFLFLDIAPDSSGGIAEGIEDVCEAGEKQLPFTFLTYGECLEGFKNFSPKTEDDVIFIDLTEKVDPEEWKMIQSTLVEMVGKTKRRVVILRDPSKPNFAFEVSKDIQEDSNNIYVPFLKLTKEQQERLSQLMKLDSDTTFEIIRTALKHSVNTSLLVDLLITLNKESEIVETDEIKIIEKLRGIFARHFTKKLVGLGVDHNLLFQTLLTSELLGQHTTEHEFLQLLQVSSDAELEIMQALIENEIILVSYTTENEKRLMLNPVINTLRYILFSFQQLVDTGMNVKREEE